MSQLTDLLDELSAELQATMTKEQITRIAVGYFASVEVWESSGYAKEGLEFYHADVKRKMGVPG